MNETTAAQSPWAVYLLAIAVAIALVLLFRYGKRPAGVMTPLQAGLQGGALSLLIWAVLKNDLGHFALWFAVVWTLFAFLSGIEAGKRGRASTEEPNP